MKVTDEMLDRAIEVYRPSGQQDRRTTREAMRDALEAVLDPAYAEAGDGIQYIRKQGGGAA